MHWIDVAQDRDQFFLFVFESHFFLQAVVIPVEGFCEHGNEPSGFVKLGYCFFPSTQLVYCVSYTLYCSIHYMFRLSGSHLQA
jgi:hypothetical protein